MKTLVISDVHHRSDKIRAYLLGKSFDKIISLGDWWDSFGDTPTNAERTAEYLRKLLKQPNFIWLLGNHDAAYVYPKNPFLRCSGNTAEKSKVIREVMGDDIYQFQFYHWDEYFLYSHAGVHPYFLPPGGWSPEWMEKRCAEARQNAEGIIYDPFLSAGLSRGGRETVGGILWSDWDDEFTPIDGINQIVGHTIHREPKRLVGVESINWDVDTNNRHFTIIEDGQITFDEPR